MISFQYDPDDAITRQIYRQALGQWRALSEIVAIAVMMLVLWGVAKIALAGFYDTFEPINSKMPMVIQLVLWMGIILGLTGAYITIFFIARFRRFANERATDTAAAKRGPVEVSIGPDGVALKAPEREQLISWKGIRRVVKTSLGLALVISEEELVPVPDGSLPEGIDRAALTDKIAKWRGVAS